MAEFLFDPSVAPPSESLWRGLQSLNEWIKFADAKAGAVLASDGVLIAVATQWSDEPGPLLLAALGLAVLSGLLAIWAVVPRLSLVKPSSPFYFDHIVRECRTSEAYREWILPIAHDPAALETSLADHIWAMSRVAKVKYKWVRLATWFLGLASCVIIIVALVESPR